MFARSLKQLTLTTAALLNVGRGLFFCIAKAVMRNIVDKERESAMPIAEQIKQKLLRLEQEVEEEKLFLVGYLIPMVDLIPVDDLTDEQWFAEFALFVEDAVESDGLSDRDVELLSELIEELQP